MDDKEYICEACKGPILEGQIFVESYKLVARDPNQPQGYVKSVDDNPWRHEPVYVHAGHFSLHKI